MKLILTSLYFNRETKTKGNTANWATSLGQKIGNQITIAYCDTYKGRKADCTNLIKLKN
jgi:hypothetical protein